MWLASPGKVINEEDGIRMFSLSQMTKVKLVCALAWRENFAKGNNSVTDAKRRMHWQTNAQTRHVMAIELRRLSGEDSSVEPLTMNQGHKITVPVDSWIRNAQHGSPCLRNKRHSGKNQHIIYGQIYVKSDKGYEKNRKKENRKKGKRQFAMPLMILLVF